MAPTVPVGTVFTSCEVRPGRRGARVRARQSLDRSSGTAAGAQPAPPL